MEMISVYLKRFSKILMLLLLVICTQANIPSVNAETAEDYQNQINSYTAQIESNSNDMAIECKGLFSKDDNTKAEKAKKRMEKKVDKMLKS